MDWFIEFCILTGCDYVAHLPKVGAKTAFQLLTREGNLAKVVTTIRAGQGPKGCTVPEDWHWEAAKELFLKGPTELSDVCAVQTKNTSPDYDAIRKLLVEGHQFSSTRVDSALERLRKASGSGGGGKPKQKRIDSFFSSTAACATNTLTCKHEASQGSQTAVNFDAGRACERKRSADTDDSAVERSKRLCTASPTASVASLTVRSPASSSSATSRLSKQGLSRSTAAPEVMASSVNDDCSLQTWSCERCTFANSGLLSYCEVCELPRPTSISAAVNLQEKAIAASMTADVKLQEEAGVEVAAVQADDDDEEDIVEVAAVQDYTSAAKFATLRRPSQVVVDLDLDE